MTLMIRDSGGVKELILASLVMASTDSCRIINTPTKNKTMINPVKDTDET